jgi:hypothetical protein
MPSLHRLPGVHGVSQLPQWSELVLTFTHIIPHFLRLDSHPTAHIPALHTWADVHALPHPPQFRGSACVSMHSLPHAVV